MRSNSKDIIERLAEVGIVVDSIYDLVNTKESYPEAIPALIELLREGVSDENNQREGVIRSLTVKEARGIAGPVLLQEYFRTPKNKEITRWVIGNAMTFAMTVNELGVVLEIVRDKSNGMSRQMFVLALSKFPKSKEVEDTLIKLLSDDDVVVHAINALRKNKSLKAKPAIEKLVDSTRPVVRKLAREYLEKSTSWELNTKKAN